MSIRQRDFILRMIEQLAEAVGRIAGLRRAGQLDEADLLVRATADGLFGPMRDMLDRLDAAGAATLLGDHEKIGAYAALCAEQAEILELRGRAAQASAERRRALELYLEAVSRAPEGNPRAQEGARALLGRVDAARLPERYRALAAKLG
ncbi:hypothetical protein AB3662_04175 [Sorangium cellulosum]|uniref:hypothetical protein n=1 Tax=Sorangium cellulosum TaxID=56 RepID=UPI003D9A43FB